MDITPTAKRLTTALAHALRDLWDTMDSPSCTPLDVDDAAEHLRILLVPAAEKSIAPLGRFLRSYVDLLAPPYQGPDLARMRSWSFDYLVDLLTCAQRNDSATLQDLFHLAQEPRRCHSEELPSLLFAADALVRIEELDPELLFTAPAVGAYRHLAAHPDAPSFDEMVSDILATVARARQL